MTTPLFAAWFLSAVATAAVLHAQDRPAQEPAVRPNILFAMADDWGWPHAGAYGDAVVVTPTFDRIAAEGVLFEQAFVSSPSCTPSRGAILTGQLHWRLGSGANLYGTFADRFATYAEVLAAQGYAAGCTGKAWGPGRPQTRGRALAGARYQSFAAFLARRPKDRPFVFWLGSGDPHRPYEPGTGAKRGMDLAKVHMFGHFPDHATVRSDVADYYFEVERFDRLVGAALAALAESGELDDTLIVMTGDHGMPFPRGKSNLYDAGTRVPLAVRWGKGGLRRGRRSAFVSLTDLAPTFLAAAGVESKALPGMTGRSLLELLRGTPAVDREHVIFGKERHVPSQEAPDLGGYPSRGLRTARFLYIRNFAPQRWPNGTPDFAHAALPGIWYGDTDNGPTKTYIIANKDRDAAHARSYALCFGKRPAEELYDVTKDPDQLVNLAVDAGFAKDHARLRELLDAELRRTGDPRILGEGAQFDAMPYSGGGPKHPSWRGRARQRK